MNIDYNSILSYHTIEELYVELNDINETIQYYVNGNDTYNLREIQLTKNAILETIETKEIFEGALQ